MARRTIDSNRGGAVPLLYPRSALLVPFAFVVGVGLPACSGPTSSTPAPEPCITPDTGLPTDLSCTGLYESRGSTELSSDVMPYTPGITFWSDGAEKQRFLYLPAGSMIDTSSFDAWKFPVGTKVWKE